MMTFDYEHVRARHEDRVARSLAAFGALHPRARGCPLERLVKWTATRRRAGLDPALLAR
ncbi:MAG: hypothetical protein ICV67_08405 [Thermoleophilia bacterium]|nr:hypothetical protein [Thermoleophilia bacterium]